MANEQPWSRTYPERINWVNNAPPQTPIDQVNLNKMDKAIFEMDARLMELGYTKIFDLSKNSWQDSDPNDAYPFYQTIESSLYSDDSTPMAMISSSGKDETKAEMDAVAAISKVWVNSTGITVYSTIKPTVDLTLTLKGY